MITEFIDGNHKTKLNRRELRELALTIKKLHKINIRQKPTSLKSHFNFKSKKVHLVFIKLKKYKKDFVFCHNDLHPQNILFSKKIKLIDWEYASFNDRYFDLASILTEFKFNNQDENYFLKIYFGQREKVEVDKLLCYKVIYRELNILFFDTNTTI
jgi:thiamine kinase-like enzyme